MNKRGGWIVIAGLIFLIVLVIILFVYFAFSGFNYSPYYDAKGASGEIKNPSDGLTDEEAAATFNESFVYYLLYNIEAYNLHNVPFSDSKPIILIYVDSDVYNAVVDSGNILVSRGTISSEDIEIRTDKNEAVRMVRDSNYVKASFVSGKSSIELKAEKTTLFAKGYLKLYESLNGAGVTGNIIRIYTGG
jgi:hypothetical protein